VHAPPPREYIYGYLGTADKLRIDDIIGAAIASFQPRRGRESPDYQLKDLGNYLADLTKLTEKGFREETIGLLLRQEVDLIARLQRLLAEYDGPSYWADDIQSWLDRRALAWTKLEGLFPYDIVKGGTPEEAWAAARTITRRYAEVLLEWPEIISAASHLREKGVRLGRPIRSA
jgi:hypothetical protein